MGGPDGASVRTDGTGRGERSLASAGSTRARELTGRTGRPFIRVPFISAGRGDKNETMSTPADSIEIQNVVASTGIGQELDLEALAEDLPGADFNPDNFPGLVYRTQNPKAAALIFRSGKIVCTGAKSIDDVHEALGIIFQKLRDLQIPVEDDPEITVQNIVSSADLGHNLNLNALAIGLGLEDVEYEPEQFPGLVYRMDEPKVVILLFGSGKIVITGGKQTSDAETAVVEIVDRIEGLGLLG
jgi:transcription initiation factor TFIID TATA-box-binding protein